MPIIIFETSIEDDKKIIGVAAKKSGVMKILTSYIAEKELTSLETELYPDAIITEDNNTITFEIVEYDELLNI